MGASMKNKHLLFLLFILPVFTFGQLSRGGIPVQIQKLKSASPNQDLVVMPALDNQKLRATYSKTNADQLKPFRFAHPFDVSLTPENSGKWYADAELNVWQLRIRSTGAYSLNLIFDQFRLPENARLFLISQTTGEIKGAFTSDNNSESRIFAVEPVAGDEILVQYEEPKQVAFPGKFRIMKVAHDFVGIAGDHRPLGLSDACNVNINCDIANGSEEVRDAVCRIIIGGAELCTGTLVNNTALDGTPYLMTAYHCISNERDAQTSVFLFNYESPYCSSIDGDVSRSLSGSSLKASFDSLDFALVRLNNLPPYNYRTYMAGWNRKNLPPASSICIHHPKGDIKKVAIDQNAAQTNSFGNNVDYVKKAFWNVLRWENGVTEQGSSGGPLFDQNKQLIGTLTGGAAFCSSPTNDYFEKFALSWDYRKETAKQLKYWLDPLNSGIEKLSGMYSYSGKLLCKPFTNFKDNDTYAAIPITNGLTKKGYYSGTNLNGYTDFAEQFKFSKNCEVQGITLGVAKVKTNPLYTTSYIDVQVYSGTTKPETLLYSEKFDIKKFWNDAMNYLPFKTSVKTVGNFFVSYNISQMHSGDTLAVYMADRRADTTNSFFLKNQTGWITYNSQNLNGNGSALLVELIACNVDDPLSVEAFKTDLPEARFFPNPLQGSSILHLQTTEPVDCPDEISVYDLLGKKQEIPISQQTSSTLTLNFSGKRPGIYLVHLETGGRQVVAKVAYIP
jgi:hypothetical protein